MKRIWSFCLILALAVCCTETAAAEAKEFWQGPFLVEPYDASGDHMIYADYTSREKPCFELLLRVRDPQGNPVGGLGCSFDGSHTTDQNGEVLLQWSGPSRELALFNRYLGRKDPGYEDTYHVHARDESLSGRQSLTLVWPHQTPLAALEQVSNLLDLRITDHRGQPKNGLTVSVFHEDRPFGEEPVTLLFSGEPGRYVWRGLKSGLYVADVTGPDGEEGQVRFPYQGERLMLELQLESPAATMQKRLARATAAAKTRTEIERVGENAVTFANLNFIPEFSGEHLGGVSYDPYNGTATVGVIRAEKTVEGKADGPSLLFTADLWEGRVTWRSEAPGPSDSGPGGLGQIPESRLLEIARRLAAVAGMTVEEQQALALQPPPAAENPAFLIERDGSAAAGREENGTGAPFGASVAVTLRVTDPAGEPVPRLACGISGESLPLVTDRRGEAVFRMRPGETARIELFSPRAAGTEERACYLATLQKGIEEPVLSLVWEGEKPAAPAENRVELTLVDEWGDPLVNEPFDLDDDSPTGRQPGVSEMLPALPMHQTDAEGRGFYELKDGTPRWLTLSAAGRSLSFYYPGGAHRLTAAAPFRMRGREELDLVLIEPDSGEPQPQQAVAPAASFPQGLPIRPVLSVQGPAPPSEAEIILRIIDREGSPVRGLGCTVSTGEGELWQRSDGFGRCRFPVPLRTPLRVALENPHAQAGAAIQRHRVTVGRGLGDGVLFFTLVWEGETPARSIERQEDRFSLTVTDVRGRPLPGVALRLEQGAKLLREGETDGYGGQVWCGLPKGNYRLTLLAGDGTKKEHSFSYPGGSQALTVPLAVEPDGDFSLGRFDPDDPGHTAFAGALAGAGSRTVTLRVLTPRGSPAEGLLVRCGGQSRLLDAAGECRLAMREGETASLSIQNDVPFPDQSDDPRFRADYRVTMRPKAQSQVLSLVWEGYLPDEVASAGRQSMHLSVTDGQDRPLPGVKLWLCVRQPEGRRTPPQGAAYTLTDEKGERTRCAVDPGSYTLFLQREGEEGYVRLDTRLSESLNNVLRVTLSAQPEIYPEEEPVRRAAVVQIPAGKALFTGTASGETIQVRLRAAQSKNTAVPVRDLCCETGGERFYTDNSGVCVIPLPAGQLRRMRLYNDLPGAGTADDPAYCCEYLIAADAKFGEDVLTAGWSGISPNESKDGAMDWFQVEVRDKEDNRYEGLRVWVVDEQSGASYGPRLTDSWGDAIFLGLPAGRYRIKVERKDKQIFETSVDYAGEGGHSCITRLPPEKE